MDLKISVDELVLEVFVDAEKWFGTFPRLGRCAICLEFRCGTVDINCGTATCRRGSPPSPLARVLGRGFEVVIGRECCPTVRQKVASSGRVKGHLSASTSTPRVPSVPHGMSDTWRENTVANPVPINRDDSGGEITLHIVRSESSVEAISDESFRYSRQFPTSVNGNQAISGIANGRKGDFRHCKRQERRSEAQFAFTFQSAN
ncbi:unnamed protein product [Prunus armeniaca]